MAYHYTRQSLYFNVHISIPVSSEEYYVTTGEILECDEVNLVLVDKAKVKKWSTYKLKIQSVINSNTTDL